MLLVPFGGFLLAPTALARMLPPVSLASCLTSAVALSRTS